MAASSLAVGGVGLGEKYVAAPKTAAARRAAYERDGFVGAHDRYRGNRWTKIERLKDGDLLDAAATLVVRVRAATAIDVPEPTRSAACEPYQRALAFAEQFTTDVSSARATKNGPRVCP